MKRTVHYFKLFVFPDHTATDLRRRTGGAVLEDIHAACAYLMALVSHGGDETTTTLTLRLYYTGEGPGPASGLQVYLVVSSENETTAAALEFAILAGGLQHFYTIARVEEPAISWKRFPAVCHLLRDVSRHRPLVAPEQNPHVPAAYLSFNPLQPDEDFNWVDLEDIFLGCPGSFVIDVAVAPRDMTALREDYARYRSALDIVRFNAREEETAGPPPRYLRDDSGYFPPYGARRTQASDPALEAASTDHYRFQETLRRPHVAFNIRVLAESMPSAYPLAVRLGNSAFLESSYRVLTAMGNDPLAEQAVFHASQGTVLELPLPAELEGTPDLVQRLEAFCCTAPAEELMGAMFLPVASDVPTQLFPRHTDPIYPEGESLLLLGEEIL